MDPVWNQTDFPWRFYYFLIACLRGRMNGSVLYETCMGFRLGMMMLYKIYIYITVYGPKDHSYILIRYYFMGIDHASVEIINCENTILAWKN